MLSEFFRKLREKKKQEKAALKSAQENPEGEPENKSKRQTKTGRILKAIGVIKVIEVTGLMLQAEIKRGE